MTDPFNVLVPRQNTQQPDQSVAATAPSSLAHRSPQGGWVAASDAQFPQQPQQHPYPLPLGGNQSRHDFILHGSHMMQPGMGNASTPASQPFGHSLPGHQAVESGHPGASFPVASGHTMMAAATPPWVNAMGIRGGAACTMHQISDAHAQAIGGSRINSQQHQQPQQPSWRLTTAGWGDSNNTTTSPHITPQVPPQQQPQQQIFQSSSPRASVDTNGGSGSAGGGAEWTPPGELVHVYEAMFAAASVGSAVPGTVSGRAAVQFFTRSGLPKETLKTIWSLCDPSLAGFIRRPGFFAAMRLIALAQGSSPGGGVVTEAGAGGHVVGRSATAPSLVELEGTRHTPLPPPSMGRSPHQQALGSSSSRGGSPLVSPIRSFSVSPVLAPVAAAAVVGGGRDGSSTLSPATVIDGGVWGATGVLGGAGSGSGYGVSSSSVAPPYLSTAPSASADGARKSSSSAEGVVPAASTSVGSGIDESQRKPKQVEDMGAGGQGGDAEDDFGDFAGAEQALQPPQQVPPTSTPSQLVVAKQDDKDDDDDDDDDFDFGEFAAAPVDDDTFSSAEPTVAPTPSAAALETLTVGSAAALNNPFSDAATVGVPEIGKDSGGGDGSGGSGRITWNTAEPWMTGDGGRGGEVGGKGKSKHGLEDLIKSNLQAATTGPMHLADMQTTPPLLGRPHDPVMVDRAAIVNSKLSVFDAMADLDLAVGQEEWTDFTDESTAPPPPPPPLPTIIPDVVESGEIPAVDSPANDDVAAAPRGDAVNTACVGRGKGGGDAGYGGDSPHPLGESGGGSPSGAFGGQTLGLTAGNPWSDVGLDSATAASNRAAETPTAEAPGAAEDSQDDDWGDFEDAGVGQRASADPLQQASSAASGDSKDRESPPLVPPALGPACDAEEEWGSFVEVPAVAGNADGGSRAQTSPLARAIPADESVEGEGRVTGAGSPEAPQPEEEVDPFAAISPPTPPPRPPRSSNSIHPGDDGVLCSSYSGSGDGAGGEEARDILQQESVGVAAEATAGLPLSLRALRDGLAGRGRLEEAAEIQRRMEISPSKGHQEDGDGETGNEERDLERWRGAMERPPAPTLQELAETVLAADAAQGERFRTVFVAGRPSVEEEALVAGGGAVALRAALQRQRAARRAVALSRGLGNSKAAAVARGMGGPTESCEEAAEERQPAGIAGVGAGEELEIDLGIAPKGGSKPPPTLSDWACMVSYVTRMLEAGVAALAEEESGADSSPPPSFLEAIEGMGGAREEGGGTPQDDYIERPPPPVCPSQQNGGAATAADATSGEVRGEVVRSSKFVAFSRGLCVAVGVCRMLQAAAEDGLETVAGFASMEKRWTEFRRLSREAARQHRLQQRSGSGNNDPTTMCDLDPNDDEEDWSVEGFMGASFAQGKGVSIGEKRTAGVPTSVEAVRKAGVWVGAPPAGGSEICAVCLQPFEAFGASGSYPCPALNVVEYCGVRYFACAVNLWVNVLDKAPPGQLSWVAGGDSD